MGVSFSNHGSYFFNQLASLYILVNDKTNAVATIDKYFNGIFMGQIDADGEQVRAGRFEEGVHRAGARRNGCSGAGSIIFPRDQTQRVASGAPGRMRTSAPLFCASVLAPSCFAPSPSDRVLARNGPLLSGPMVLKRAPRLQDCTDKQVDTTLV